ncbi:MAG: SPOR domain-containing protein [Bacteroidales bacterium]|nr:SPOR domain-containing protein [Bacteroidales bacterium]
MKKTLLLISALLLSMAALSAQNNVTASALDTLPVYEPLPSEDISYSGKNIFDILAKSSLTSGTVNIEQSSIVKSAFARHIARNSNRKITGYRVRIFFDNSRNARAVSEQVAGSFSAIYPNVAVYREYENPYFKVTVGNFRTKADATRVLNNIKGQFPSGFIVRERITYPSF